MVQTALTDLEVRNLKANKSKRYEVFDGKVPGFAVRVFPSGGKSFVLLYRQGGRVRRLTIGQYPTLSVADARRLARKALNDAAHGVDPQADKDEARQAVTFTNAVETFVETYAGRFNRASTAKEYRRLLTVDSGKSLGEHELRLIRREDLHKILDELVKVGTPGTANHVLAAARTFFSWCLERGILEASPSAGIKMPAPIRSRDRVLSGDELQSVWRGATAIRYPFGTIVQLLILTAQRRGEVGDMRWSELNFDNNTWTLPASRTKSSRAHTVPLTPAAVKILDNIPKRDDERVFPADGGNDSSFSGYSKAKRRLDLATGVVGWVLHDLRRTAATGMAQHGVPPHVVERILNHTTGTLGGVAGVYNRFGYLPEMRAALLVWSHAVTSDVEEKTGTEEPYSG